MELELIDLVNENDEVIGVINRKDKSFNTKKNVRGVNLFLLTDDFKIVVPIRSNNRAIFPNCYDFSAAGMVDSNETYEIAIYRELKEELFIENITLKEIAYLNPFKDNAPIFLKLYLGNINYKIKNYDKDGISKILYLTLDEVEALLKRTPNLFKTAYEASFNILKKYLKENQ